MAVVHQCDQCNYQQPTPLPFTVTQITDELDDDGEPVTITLDLCTAQCLSDLAMGLSLDFPDDGDP